MRPLSRRGVSALRKAASARNRQTRGGTAIVRPLLARAEGVFDGKERFMRQKTCPYCGGKMQSLGNMELQKGKFSMLFGHWDQILSGALDVDVECCERCKKLEFYLLGDAEAPESSGIQQIACPYCGDLHDMDDAICPHCGRRLMEL